MWNALTTMVVFLGVGAVIAIISLVAAQTKEWQKKAFLTFGNRVHLWVSDDAITAAVTRRLRLSATGQAVGALVGIGVVFLIALLAPGIPFRTLIYVIAFPIVLVAVSLFPVLLALRDELYRHDDEGPRVARAVPVGIRDYVSPARLWAAPVFGAVAAVLAVLGVILSLTGQIDGRRYFGSVALPWTAVAVVLLVLGWVAASSVVRRNQSATDGLELAWSDALRADTLRNLWALGTVVAWLAVAISALGILGALPAPIDQSWAGIILQTSATWGSIIVSRVFYYGAAYNYFRYRLWPDLGDVGEIVDESDAADAGASRP